MVWGWKCLLLASFAKLRAARAGVLNDKRWRTKERVTPPAPHAAGAERATAVRDVRGSAVDAVTAPAGQGSMAAKEMAAAKADPAQELQPTLTIDEMPPALARPDIGWYDMDLTRFVMWNCSIFFCIRCIVYPSMLIKTRLQAQHRVRHSFVFSPHCIIASLCPCRLSASSPSATLRSYFGQRDRYTGVWNAFTGVLKREGPRGLYQGFVPFQTGSIFSQFLCTPPPPRRGILRLQLMHRCRYIILRVHARADPAVKCVFYSASKFRSSYLTCAP